MTQIFSLVLFWANIHIASANQLFIYCGANAEQKLVAKAETSLVIVDDGSLNANLYSRGKFVSSYILNQDGALLVGTPRNIIWPTVYLNACRKQKVLVRLIMPVGPSPRQTCICEQDGEIKATSIE